MTTVNVHAAKTHFSSLLDRVGAGEGIIIAKAGKPVARLAPLVPADKPKRRLGLLHDRAKLPSDFDAPLPDTVLDAFES